MLIGELITGLFAVESQMVIGQGETVNFVQRAHELELAITDATPTRPARTSSPCRCHLLRKGGSIHERRPAVRHRSRQVHGQLILSAS